MNVDFAKLQQRSTAGLETCLLLLQQAVSPRSRYSAWLEEVRVVVADLEKLNRTTEADFLAVGGNLMAFLTSCRQLHSEISALTDLVSGEQVQTACEALVSVRSYVQGMQQRSAQSDRSLLSLQSSADRINRGFSTLGQIARSFQITAILARIETAHLAMSQQDLTNLGDQVISCSDGMQTRAQQVLEVAAAFRSRIAATLREISRFDEIRDKELFSLLTAVDSDLQLFEARQREASSASSQLGVELTSVTQDLGAISTSIQCHDITRQQLEHVIEVLTDLLRDAPRRAPSPAVAAKLKVQKAQLESAAAAFNRSTQNIDHDLETIAAKVAAMASASKAILGLEQSEKDSVLSGMQQRLKAVLRALEESNSLEQAARAIISDLEKLSQRLRASVTEVEEIELQLSRISINGAIAANHIGFTADPLSVVAGAMQSLQLECASRSREARSDLDAIGKVILSFAGTNAGNADKAQSSVILDDLNQRMDDLGAAGASSAAASSTVAALAESLCTKLQEARDHAGIGSRFAETVTRCCQVLASVASQAQPLWSLSASVMEEAPEERYTMQAERDIQRAVTNGEMPSILEEAPVEVENEVEFF